MTTVLAPRTLAGAAVAAVVLGSIAFVADLSGIAAENRESIYWAAAHISMLGALAFLAPMIAGAAGGILYAGYATGVARAILWIATVLALSPLPLIGLYTGVLITPDALRNPSFLVWIGSMGATVVASVAAIPRRR